MEKNINIEGLLKQDFDKIKAKISFETGTELLEELIQKVESGELPLEQAVASYELGTKLHQHLKGLLGDAEKKLEIIKVKE